MSSSSYPNIWDTNCSRLMSSGEMHIGWSCTLRSDTRSEVGFWIEGRHESYGEVENIGGNICNGCGGN